MVHLIGSDSSPSARRGLQPARALLTPTWLGALALLVANDHWLKGSGLLPGVLSGKLSDFAGMLVAPALLAALLQARSRRALLACHVAVAAVFAGIQLWAGFAGQWSALMGLLGHPWAITCDPTDLIALPFLLLSWKLLVPEMEGNKPALVPLQRTAVAGASVFGLWATVATSEIDSGVDPDGEWYEDVYGHVYVNNANDFEISLHVRRLREDVTLDCMEIATDPGRLLSEDAFGEAEHWLLPARTNVGIDLTHSSQCGAAWIAGEGIAPRIMFVDLLTQGPAWYGGQSFDPELLGQGGIGVRFGAEQGTAAEWLGDDQILFVPTTDAPEQPQSCEASPAESRIDWPTWVPAQNSRLLSVTPGVDGCFELELQGVGMVGGELVPIEDPYPWYLCVPKAAMPFVADDLISVTEIYGAGAMRELEINLLDPGSLTIARDEQGRPLRRARYLRGGHELSLVGPAINRTLVAVPSVSCPWQVEESCANVGRPVELAVEGGQGFLEPSSPVSFADGTPETGLVRTAVLGRARQRAAVDLSCSEGALQLSYDIDFAVVEEPLG